MNLRTKVLGHTLHCVHLMHMVDMVSVIEFFVVFHVEQQHLLQLEVIICTKMSKKRYCWKLLLARNIFTKNALVNTGAFLIT
jgi:hypothetical protein